MRKTLLLLTISCCVLALASLSPAAPAPGTRKAAVPAAIAPKPVQPPSVANAVLPVEAAPEKEVYVYSSSGRRDPFYSLIAAAKAAEKRERKKILSPLEEYDIGQMKLVAVVHKSPDYYALIKLPDGKYFTLVVGKRVGSRNGVVVHIGPAAMTVQETVKDVRGNASKKLITLKLREEEGNRE